MCDQQSGDDAEPDTGRERAEQRHAFVVELLEQFDAEVDGRR